MQFKRDLDARGITLVVMPTPLKPGVHPEMLARRYAGATGVLQNPSYRAFVDDSERDGVLVFDPSEALAAARAQRPAVPGDRHALAAGDDGDGGGAGSPTSSWRTRRCRRRPIPATGSSGSRCATPGDIARMLDLPEDAALFPPEARLAAARPAAGRIAVALVARRGRAGARRQLQQHLLARIDGLGHVGGLRRATELQRCGGPSIA